MPQAVTSAANENAGSPRNIDVMRLTVATGVTAAVVLLLCWLGTFLPYSSPTHAYISLFTNAPITSGAALAQGLCWSLVFGALAGAVFALIYNGVGALEPR